MAENDLGLEEEETVQLLGAENYIIFPLMRGKISIWINCDKEMQVKMTLDDFKKAAPSLFPQIHLPDILFYLTRGDYVFTDKNTIRPLRPQEIQIQNPVPTLNEVMHELKNRENRFKSPFFRN